MNTTNHQLPTANQRIALITGASRGIGFEAAKRLAREGCHVIAVARSQKGLEDLDDAIRREGGSATLVQLDLQEFSKYESIVQMIAGRFGRLDVLVGNAGILGELCPLADSDPGEWHKVFDINLHANFHLIRLLHPLLMASAAARIVLVTSGAATGARPYWGAYAASKAALESMLLAYAGENMKTHVRANLLDPGRTRTRMRAQAFPGEDPDTLPLPESLGDLFARLASPALTESGQCFRAY